MIVRALAAQTVRDAIRDRVPWTVGLLLALLAGAVPLAGTGVAAYEKAGRDLGLALVWLVACVVALRLGAVAFGGDLASGSASLWLSRPVSASAWVGGRALGVLAVLMAEVAALTLAFEAVALLGGFSPDLLGLLGFAILLWGECALLAAWSALLSVLVPPLPATLAAAGLWIAGHLASEYARLARVSESPILAGLARSIFSVVPDLDRFDVQGALANGKGIGMGEILAPMVLSGIWTFALFASAAAIVHRRDVL